MLGIWNEEYVRLEAPIYEEGDDLFYVDGVKPYLRSLSKMTKEEKEELKILVDAEEVTTDFFGFLEGGTLEEYVSRVSYSLCCLILDWLLLHHFDVRGLIPKGSIH